MHSKKTLSGIIFVISLLTCNGCTTLNQKLSLDSDRTAQTFFNDLQRSDRQGAYHLFGKGLSQTISFGQFDDFMDTLKDHWGRIEEEQTSIMPFHKRIGEGDFIPLNTPPENIKRYVFDVKFENAQVNFDLTLVPDGEQYKIVWFSIWGSGLYMTPAINQKIQELFSTQADVQ